MFEWFRRKSPDRPEPPSQPPAQPQPRLALASDPAQPKLPEGPHVPIRYRGPAMILTSEVEPIAAAALEEAVRRRIPDIDFRAKPAAKPGNRPTALGTYPADPIKAMQSGRGVLFCGVTYIPDINLDGMDKQSFVTSSWWWPETREVVARTKAHAVTVVLGQIDKTPAKERILVELQLAAAALDVLKSATAVIWPDANAMWKPDYFCAGLEVAKGDIPVPVVVAVKIGRDTENLHPNGTPTWFARTEGLHAFGIMEIEWRAFAGKVPDLHAWLNGIAWYLINKGPIIGDGHSMGTDAPGVMPPVVIRHEPSTTVLGTRAYVVYPQPVS